MTCAACGGELTGKQRKWCSRRCYDVAHAERQRELAEARRGPQRNCERCGEPLTGNQRRWCSAYCVNNSPGPANGLKCEHCGKELTGRQRRWCSTACIRDHATSEALINDVKQYVRTCRTCGLQKVLAVDFYQLPGGGYRRNCRSCVMAGNRERNTQPDAADKRRSSHLKGLYGITSEQYDEVLRAQNGVCAICGKPPIHKRLAVDHDHRSGLIRGLLCSHCNLRIVSRTTDARMLRRAADYLEEPPAQKVLGPCVVPKNRPRKRRRSRRKKAA